MIMCRSPLRMSFFGGGTDLPSFFEKEFGCVISTTIDRYVHLISHDSFSDDYKIHYSDIETVSSKDDIKNTRVKAVLNKLNQKGAIEIYSIGGVPYGTGLGSSSSFTVGLLNLINASEGKFLPKERLAEKACEIEINNLEEPIGKQDQYAAAHGGFNYIQFNSDASVKVVPLNLSDALLNRIQERIVVFYLNKTRSAAKILKEQSSNVNSQKEKFLALRKMRDIALSMKKDLEKGNIENFGKMLHENWMIKKSLASSISDSTIDEIYNKGLSAGAEGGKVLGAGGGGFIMFYCEPENQDRLRNELSDMKEFRVAFENKGAQIVYKC